MEHAPVTHSDPSPLATVGHVVSRPFTAPTSSSALLIDLCLLLVALAIGLVFWFELGGGPGGGYESHRRLVGLLDMARRQRDAS